jgi:short chain dehydrogenase
VVNNAGYANVAPIETADDEDFRAQFETNFWGVYHVSRAAIPILRRDGGGLVVQISSIGGRVGNSPGLASYQAAKFAIDGFSHPAGPPGDPDRAASIIVELAKRRDIPEHLTLGVVASEIAIAQDQRRLEEDRRWAAVSRSADACEPFPVEMPTDTQEPPA